MSFKTVVEAYSLAQGEVGKSIEGSLVVESHPDGIQALLALDKAMRDHPQVQCQGLRFEIEMPDDRRVAFDAAYTEIFGEPPVKQGNRENLYPRLKSHKPRATPRPSM